MPTVTPPAIAAPPAFPPVGDAAYNTKAYTWANALPTFGTEIAAVAANVKANADDCSTNATTATTKAAEATAAASAATATANAVAWVNGGTYALNANAISGVDFQTYRKITASSVTTTDPSADSTNWVGLGGVPSQSGNAGKHLSTNGSVASWVSPGMTLLATLTPTAAAANVDFLNAFSSTYDNYLIVGSGLTPSGTDQLRVQLAVAGAADTAANYYTTSALVATATSTAVTNWTVVANTGASGKGADFSLQIKNVNSSGAKFGLSHSITENNTANNFVQDLRGLVYPPSSVVTGVRFFWNSASNFAATGVIRVYGYANT